MPAQDNLLTVKETAAYLRIPLPTVYYLVQRGLLPAIQIGGRWRIKKDLLDRDVLHEENGGGQPTALVVDDDAGVRDLFNLFLKQSGVGRVIVSTGQEALTALHKQKFDISFIDLVLPDITGDEIYREARELYPDMQIVIITGYPDSTLLNNILTLGPVTVLKKPLKLNQLTQILKMLGRKITPAK